MKDFFISPDSAHIKKEREKARKLKKTPWWYQKKQKGICYHCGKKFAPQEITMDHQVPLARGGKTGKNNIVASCKICNSQKSYQTLVGFKLKRSEKI